MTAISPYSTFIEQRQKLLNETSDPALKKHYQAEIDLVNSWDSGDIRDPDPEPVPVFLHQKTSKVTTKAGPPSLPVNELAEIPVTRKTVKPEETPEIPETQENTPTNFSQVPHGYATDWHTIRFSNTTNEPITVHVTMSGDQPFPKGVDANGNVTIQPGEYVDLTFPPGSSANFKSTKGDGSVWNQGEVHFDEANHVIWGNMSYIYGANSNMRIFSQDGQYSGYRGDLFANTPQDARIGNWGIMAPYDRFNHSDDPNNPSSATGGPNGPKNPGAAYLYSLLDKGEGYVGRGRPAEITDYDDASSLRFTGNVAVVF